MFFFIGYLKVKSYFFKKKYYYTEASVKIVFIDRNHFIYVLLKFKTIIIIYCPVR